MGAGNWSAVWRDPRYGSAGDLFTTNQLAKKDRIVAVMVKPLEKEE